jgi:hypothetical protein
VLAIGEKQSLLRVVNLSESRHNCDMNLALHLPDKRARNDDQCLIRLHSILE